MIKSKFETVVLDMAFSVVVYTNEVLPLLQFLQLIEIWTK